MLPTPRYLDCEILVIEKPAGLAVLPGGWAFPAPISLKEHLETRYGQIWVVHRLDKLTSGIMVFARTANAHRFLNEAFSRRRVKKVYHALVQGIPPWEEKICKFPLRANADRKHRTRVDRGNGKPSETRFRVLKRNQDAAWVEASPKTGRTHQIRAHLAALGYPILGDTLYGARPLDGSEFPPLHAFSISFPHPESEEEMHFTAPVPNSFYALFQAGG